MKQLGMIFLGLFFTISAFAKDLTVNLTVANMQASKQQETKADELYFDIAEYTQKGLQQFYRVPEKPIHLLSTHLKKVNNFNLWHNTLKNGESTEVIISLIEEDYSPWDLDDLIGVVKLKIKNEKGKLVTAWSMPNTTNQGLVLTSKKGELRRFVLTDGKAKYQVDLQLSY